VRDLQDLSGPWTGFWVQQAERVHMHLTLNFANGNVTGGGRDQIGGFSVNGIYAQDTGRVLFTKTFSTHSVEYSGTWDDRMIAGAWMMDYGTVVDRGEFEIWPEKGGEAEEEQTEPAEEVRELASQGPATASNLAQDPEV
jgi:hypothetical protein